MLTLIHIRIPTGLGSLFCSGVHTDLSYPSKVRDETMLTAGGGEESDA